MIPLLTTSQMREADVVATSSRGTDALVRAAGTAVALEAQRMLGSCYGSRVAVIVGPGLNGADGRVAARWLMDRGAKVRLVEVADQPSVLEGFDLVIDAAFGLGCTRAYDAPSVTPGTLVLAVDLPSGVDTDTGAVLGAPLRADVTVALGAMKPAHVDGESVAYMGEVRFAGLGIVRHFDDGVLDDGDLAQMIEVDRNDHKWDHAVQILAGSTQMPGAAELCVRGAIAGGASMVRLASRSSLSGQVSLPPEVVHATETSVDRRCRAVGAGPGLGEGAAEWLAERLDGVSVPVVLDADGLDRSLLREAPSDDRRWVLTPHEGEFVRLTGEPLGSSRIAAVRALARDTGCVVLLKGPITLIAHPSGKLRVVRSGTAALATAGSGDVLTGLITASIARGHDPFTASALAAHLHGRAGAALSVYAPASDLAGSTTAILDDLVTGVATPGAS